MNAKPTPILFVAVVLSALAAVLAGSAQARIPEGNGTQPPSKTVVNKQQSLQELLASFAQARIPEGNGTQPPSKTVATEQQAQLVTGTFFFSFTPDPAIYVVYGALISPTERQARQGSGTFTVDPKICANLDRRDQGRNPAVPLTLCPACRQGGQDGYGPEGRRTQVPRRLPRPSLEGERHRGEKTGRPPPRLSRRQPLLRTATLAMLDLPGLGSKPSGPAG